MDDMLFSRDTLNEVQFIANEAVKVLDSRGFKLVNWPASKKAKAIIAVMDKDNLAKNNVRFTMLKPSLP